MKDREKLKKSSEYKTLQIRIPPSLKIQRIRNKVKSIQKDLNKCLAEDKKVWRENHILLEAIEIGLKKIEEDIYNGNVINLK